MKHIIFFLLLYSWFQTTLIFGQTDDFQKIELSFFTQLESYPQEKIHLHTDRDFYVPGEKIWFKAYVTEAATHQYPTFSRYLYVELINTSDSLISRVMIRQIDDMFHGYLQLKELIPEGNYTLRAYTRYMENQGDDYFFKKNIRIGNLASSKPSPKEREKTGRDDFDVSFFPEGGNLVEGVLCKVAFKAINKSGYFATITGKLIDEEGIEITEINTLHAGMGIFVFTPLSGKKYYLKCRNENSIEKQFELPPCDLRAYSLSISKRSNNLYVEVQHADNAPEIPLFLLAHCRGILLYFSAWDKGKKSAVFANEMFPAGVIQFVVFDEYMNPLSERLVFSKNYDEAKVEFQTNKSAYALRDKVIATFSLFDSDGYHPNGHFSLSVTDDNDIEVDESVTIASSLLISSELKGYIENPAYYLKDNLESANALDLLMMTHGWRRYNIPEIVKGNPEFPKIPFQESQSISGNVKNIILSRPVSDSEILIMSEEGGTEITSTEANGVFNMHDLDFPDSTAFIIQALSRNGRSNVQLFVDNESFPELVYAPQSPLLTPPLSTGEGEGIATDAFIVKAEQRAKYDEDMWVIYLDEVEITAQRINRRDAARLQYWANISSSSTIRRDEIEKYNMQYVSDYLQLRPGVTVTPDGRVYIRSTGASNRAGGGLPIVLIDGIEQAWPDTISSISSNRFLSPLERIPVSAIESIDVFAGADAVAFGMRGANGAISITTRRGENSPFVEKPNLIKYTPLGYQKPVEFYSPKYESLEAKYLTVPDYRTTIFWKPDIVITEDKEETSFEFYTSDFPTTYSVVIEGLTTDGKIVRQVEKIRVE